MGKQYWWISHTEYVLKVVQTLVSCYITECIQLCHIQLWTDTLHKRPGSWILLRTVLTYFSAKLFLQKDQFEQIPIECHLLRKVSIGLFLGCRLRWCIPGKHKQITQYARIYRNSFDTVNTSPCHPWWLFTPCNVAKSHQVVGIMRKTGNTASIQFVLYFCRGY